MIAALVYLNLGIVSALELTNFFPFGAENGDTTIIDIEKGIRLTKHVSDDNYFITASHIPFFHRKNNTIAQLSIKGYIVFGNVRYVSFVPRQFPVRIRSNGQPYRPAIIAGFWNDLSFQYNGSKFTYQIHTAGNVIIKTANNIKNALDVNFVPNFVLVVTWYNVNIFSQKQKSTTFQMALACDLTSTFLFLHYNETRGINTRTTIGWQNDLTHFHHPYNHKPDRIQSLAVDSNVNVSGRWVYEVGQPAGNYPRMSKLPAIEVTSKEKRILFKCVIHARDQQNNSTFEVIWLDKSLSILKNETLRHGANVSYFSDGDNLASQNRFCLGSEIFCKVRTWYESTPNERSPFFESNKFFAGLKIDPKVISLKEDATAAHITVRSTVPFVCADTSTGCRVELQFAVSNRDVVLNKCSLTFGTGFPTVQNVSVVAREDFVDDGTKELSITPVIRNVINTLDWSCYQEENIQVIAKSIPSGYCSVTGDPYVTTFDRLWYAFFNVGDYILVQSPKNNLKVHIRTFECLPGVTCVCGIAAKEAVTLQDGSRKDILGGIKFCGRRRNPVVFLNSPLCKITVSNSIYKITLPSGVIFSFQIQQRRNRRSFGNIYITLPSRYYERTSGLCGQFDGNPNNDMTSKNGVVSSASPVWPADRNFINSWKIRDAHDSLFTILRTEQTQTTACDALQVNEEFCFCQNRSNTITADCSLNPVGFTGGSRERNIRTSNLQDCSSRKRRALSDDIIVQVDFDENDDDTFQSKDIEFSPPAWPTPTGKTEEATRIMCIDAILNSTAGNSCASTLKIDFDLDAFKNECISDVLVSDSYDYLTSIVNTMSASCEEKILRGVEKYWIVDESGELAPPVTLGNKICQNDCNQHGLCVNRSCVCHDKFVGSDCFNVKGQIPILLARYKLCDIKNGNCLTAGIEGDGYIESNNLTCKLRRVNIRISQIPSERFGIEFQSIANLLSYAEVICNVPSSPLVINGDPKIGQGNPVGGYEIHVSNDGKIYSLNDTIFIVYDSKCIKCNVSNGLCIKKSNSCLINGYCFSLGELNPNDFHQHCDPSRSTDSFVIKPGNTVSPTSFTVNPYSSTSLPLITSSTSYQTRSALKKSSGIPTITNTNVISISTIPAISLSPISVDTNNSFAKRTLETQLISATPAITKTSINSQSSIISIAHTFITEKSYPVSVTSKIKRKNTTRGSMGSTVTMQSTSVTSGIKKTITKQSFSTILKPSIYELKSHSVTANTKDIYTFLTKGKAISTSTFYKVVPTTSILKTNNVIVNATKRHTLAPLTSVADISSFRLTTVQATQKLTTTKINYSGSIINSNVTIADKLSRAVARTSAKLITTLFISPSKTENQMSSTTRTSIKCPNSLCIGKTNGNYKHPDNPHFILQCVNEKAHCTSCWPKSLFFVPDCNKCLYEQSDAVKCISSSISSKTTASSTVTPGTTRTPIITLQTTKVTNQETTLPTTTTTTTILMFKCPNICKIKAPQFSGVMAHPTHKNYFMSCWLGRRIACMKCPASLFFNEAIGACDFPWNL